MYVGFSWECQGALRVLARSDNHTFTFFLADENDLFLFQAEKRQQVCETGQRLRSLESGLRRQQHYILGIFWNLCQFKSFRRLVTVPGSRSQQFFTNLAATAVLLQHSGNTFEYVGPTRWGHIPDKDERGWGRQNCRLLLYWLVTEISSFPLN